MSRIESTLDSPETSTAASPRMRRSSRLPIVFVMILALLGSAGTRQWAEQYRQAAVPTRGGDAQSGASLSGMNSFAMGLLLGGLRGPLVMILWTESENAKTEKDLEGVDTMIEWIRLLQPEFDTVHIFQIWNKAYNLSVQMASMANKYDVILGALDYAAKVDREKPDDINIVAQIGQLYFDKFGMSSEKYFYRKRVREQTLPHPVTSNLRTQDIGYRRVSLDPVLDDQFNVLKKYTTPLPGRARPANLPADQEWNEGTDLQYLPQFGPYPDGVSTFGLAFNYYKRAEVLQNLEQQHHDQLSDLVIDSRPGLSLKFWGEDELEQGRRREIEAFDLANVLKADMTDPDMFLGSTEHVKFDQPIVNRHALDLALADYEKAARLLPESLTEYLRHIQHFPERELQYRSYMEEIRTELQVGIGDYQYLEAMVCPPADRAEHLAKAVSAYDEARRLSDINLLRYYVDRSLVIPSLPAGFALDSTADLKPIEDLSLAQADSVLALASLMKVKSGNTYVNTDRYEFDRYIEHCKTREESIAAVK